MRALDRKFPKLVWWPALYTVDVVWAGGQWTVQMEDMTDQRIEISCIKNALSYAILTDTPPPVAPLALWHMAIKEIGKWFRHVKILDKNTILLVWQLTTHHTPTRKSSPIFWSGRTNELFPQLNNNISSYCLCYRLCCCYYHSNLIVHSGDSAVSILVVDA